MLGMTVDALALDYSKRIIVASSTTNDSFFVHGLGSASPWSRCVLVIDEARGLSTRGSCLLARTKSAPTRMRLLVGF